MKMNDVLKNNRVQGGIDPKDNNMINLLPLNMNSFKNEIGYRVQDKLWKAGSRPINIIVKLMTVKHIREKNLSYEKVWEIKSFKI